MTNLDIKVSIKQLSNYSGHLKKDTDEETLLLIIKSFAEYLKSLYILSIKEEMFSRRYKGKWEPVDEEGYLIYLEANPSVHILSLIEDAMVVEKVGYNFLVRIDPHYRYPDSPHTLITVLRAIESGTTKFNARPLMRKIASDINHSILDLWRGYLLQRGVG